MKKNLIILLFWVSQSLFGQLIEKGYYMFPINPGKPASLSGNMGELRSNHFHAGLDIKTGGVEGLPVYASADGYVSRIKVSSYGYGWGLYIDHPNGQTTVYAHLQHFSKEIEKKAIQEMYKNQSYELEYYPTKSEFPVKKGDIIGRSGNSGGSGGPHLHWEIRDANERPMNILTTEFSEVKDNVVPVIYKVGFTTLGENSHFNNEFGFFTLTPTKTGLNTYVLKDLNALGKIGLALNANDKLNGSSNNNGLAGIEVKVNDEIAYSYFNDRFTFAESKMINEHIEFDRYIEGYGHFHRCYKVDGNKLDFYKTNKNQGYINVELGKSYKINVRIWDAYKNESTLTFTIVGKSIGVSIPPKVATTTKVKHKVFEDILRVSVPNNGKDLSYFKFGKSFVKSPLYTKGDECLYTFDLSKEKPDSIIKGSIKYNLNFGPTILPFQDQTAYLDRAIVRFERGCLKDTMYLQYKYQNDVFEIGNEFSPIYQKMKFILKPMNSYPNKDKTGVFYDNGNGLNFVESSWLGNNLEFRNNKLGTYKILTDESSPTITLLTKNTQFIRIKINDNLAGIKKWEASLDGKYILMSYRYQTGTLQTLRLDENIPLKGLFKLEVEDNVGNRKVYSLQL